MYVDTEESFEAIGMLFVYNHDGGYDRDFATLVDGIAESNFEVEAPVRGAIIGPDDIEFLTAVANDLRTEVGKSLDRIRFHYPDLVQTKATSPYHSCATVEMLTAPWISAIVQEDQGAKHILYYRHEGSDDEFKYLIDFLFRYQVVASEQRISIRCPYATPTAPAQLQTAKKQYASRFPEVGGLEGRLDKIEFGEAPLMTKNFSEVYLGMEPRDG